MTKDKIKPEYIKYTEKKKNRTHRHVMLKGIFSDSTPLSKKKKSNQTKINQRDYIKLQKFCVAKKISVKNKKTGIAFRKIV